MGTIRHAILLIGALLLSHQGFAAEFTVDSTVDDVDLTPGDGVCVTAPGQCTLRAAIQETNALNGVDTINLPSGTYELTIPSESSESEDRQGQQYVDESGDLDIIDELTIIGSGLEATVIDATSVSARVVHIAPGATVRLEGLRIQGGRGVEDGGGIHNAGVLTMGDCVVSDNNAEQYHHYFPSSGGGIYNSGTLMLHETAVHHNSAQSGGGIQNEGGDISMFNGALYSNHARIYSLRPTLRRPGWGGGLSNVGGTIILSGVTIAWNRADTSFLWESPFPGILNWQGQLTVDNSTVSGNYLGGGEDHLYVTAEIENGDQMTLNNVTIGELGLGNRNEGTVQLRNTLITGPCTGTIQSLGHNLIADATGCTLLGDGLGNLIGVDPRLGPLQDNGGPTETRALLTGSPAIDAGDAETCVATDQRGISRPLDGDFDEQAICDIGAYEADGSEIPPSLASALLPGSRSVSVGNPATAFATIVNTAAVAATGCTIAPITNFSANFLYQTTDPITNEPTGTPNTAADIEPGAGQTFLVALTPDSELREDVPFRYACTNTDPAPVITGINTLLLSASTFPIPDIVAVNATINNDGIVTIPGETGSGVFAVATVNVGAAGAITVSADTGSVTLPVNVFVCETNPNTSVCLAEPGPEVTTTIESNATPTFGVFVVGGGAVPLDPANNRIFVRFKEEYGQTHGLTSVAVTTAP